LWVCEGGTDVRGGGQTFATIDIKGAPPAPRVLYKGKKRGKKGFCLKPRVKNPKGKLKIRK